MIPAIETTYAGCRFRSRLEARWAVFFDHLGIPWQYEPQGYVVAGRPYLPDFLLSCGTWIEVKGAEGELDHALMLAAAAQLPTASARVEHGPALMILGPIPDPPVRGDIGWLGLDPSVPPGETEPIVSGAWFGFDAYHKNHRPWFLCNTSSAPPNETDADWLSPAVDEYEPGGDASDAYRAARSARFEHGESGVRK